MIEVILACTPKYGIGLNGSIPWRDRDELALFKSKTMGSVVISGRKTAEYLPCLEGREMLTLSKNGVLDNIQTAIQHSLKTFPTKKIFIIGQMGYFQNL